MMKSRLDFTLDEADNADNLLLWEQEVFSWAGSEIEESRRKSPAWVCGVPVGASLRLALTRVPKGCAEGRSPFAEGLGVSPSFSTIPPRLGARGLKRIPSTLPHGFV
jgi:hypothetical protein